jgi:hypothetical protein
MKSKTQKQIFLITVFFNLILATLSFASTTANEQKGKIHSVTVDYYFPKYYFRWLVNDIKHDGFFIVEGKRNKTYMPVQYKPAIGSEFNGPLMYCVTLVDSFACFEEYRVRYLNEKGDTLVSQVSDANIHYNTIPTADYIRLKISKDSLYDEVAITIAPDSAPSNNIAKKDLFLDPENPRLFTKSGSTQYCVQKFTYSGKENMVPVYFKHNTGGLYTLTFTHEMQDKNMHVYLKKSWSKELIKLESSGSTEIYTTSHDDGSKPAFYLVFSSEELNVPSIKTFDGSARINSSSK